MIYDYEQDVIDPNDFTDNGRQWDAPQLEHPKYCRNPSGFSTCERCHENVRHCRCCDLDYLPKPNDLKPNESTPVGRAIDSLILRIQRTGKWFRRNGVSFFMWLRELAENAMLKRKLRRMDKVEKPKKIRKSLREYLLMFKYIGMGLQQGSSWFVGLVVNAEGKKRVLRAKKEVEDKYQLASGSPETSALWTAHKMADKRAEDITKDYNRAVTVRVIATAGLVASDIYFRQQIGDTLATVDPYALGTVCGLLSILSITIAFKKGRTIVMARDGEIEGFVPTADNVDPTMLKEAFEFIGIKGAQCISGGIIEKADKSGWHAFMQLPKGKTASDDVLSQKQRRSLSSAIGGLDASQLVLSKHKTEDKVKVEVFYDLPEDRPVPIPSALTATEIDAAGPFEHGVDESNQPASLRRSHASLWLGKSGRGKSNGLNNLVAPVVSTPNGVLFFGTLKFSKDNDWLLMLANWAVKGDRDKDRGALAEIMRMLKSVEAEANRRAEILNGPDGAPEVTEEMKRTDPRFPPFLCIIDESPFLFRDDEYGTMMKDFIRGLVETIRFTGIELVFTAQSLSPNGIDHNFAGIFETAVVYKVGSNPEAATVCGNDAVRTGRDATQFNRKGQCVLVGNEEGLTTVQAYHWTEEHKKALYQKSIERRGEPKRWDTPAPQLVKVERDLIRELNAIREAGTFGDKGVGGKEEFAALAKTLNMSVDELKAELRKLNISTQTQMWKDGSNKKGFLFDHISKEEAA